MELPNRDSDPGVIIVVLRLHDKERRNPLCRFTLR